MVRWILGLGGAATVMILPGAWITFSPLGRGLRTVERLAIAIALSPLVVWLEALLLRGAGVQFGPAALALVPINLPAIWLMLRAPREQPGPRRDRELAVGLGSILAGALPFAFLLRLMGDPLV